MLTVNGKAELVKQDARWTEKLLAVLEEADLIGTLRRRLASIQAGTARTRSFEEAIEELPHRTAKPRRKG